VNVRNETLGLYYRSPQPACGYQRVTSLVGHDAVRVSECLRRPRL